MTLESIVSENYRLLKPCETVDLYEIGEVPCLYSPVDAQSSKPPQSRINKPVPINTHIRSSCQRQF